MQFILFRISLIPAGAPLLFTSLPNTHVERFDWLTTSMEKSQKGTYRNIEYQFMNVKRSSDDVVFGRLAHPDTVDRSVPAPDGRTLKDQSDPTFVWTRFVFFGIGEQILAVHRKAEFFSGSDDGLRQLIEAILNASAKLDGLMVAAELLTDSATFWDIVNRSRKRFMLSFHIDRPNVFSNNKELEKITRIRHELYNATESTDTIRNPTGELVIKDAPGLREQVEHVSSGGGKWELDATDSDGERRMYSSTNNVQPKTVTMENDIKHDEEDGPAVNLWLQHIVAKIRSLLPKK